MNLKNNLTVLFKSIEFEDEWLSIQISSDIFNILFLFYILKLDATYEILSLFIVPLHHFLSPAFIPLFRYKVIT